MSTVIKVENLGKRYLIGHQNKERFPTFRDAMVRGTCNIGRRLLHPLKASAGSPLMSGGEVEDFWALKDVSFEVQQGERIGIIGRNGAGKSTLLKIFSRITEPTTGRVSLKGRVASLLEVGTGFHPELTGRENIFLNGAILGMSKEEIRRRFDEIVDFAEVEKFLDTPVKRYSSGMRVRLGFSVAAHLEPEILIVDEVLAVGDAQFQKKCIGKMGEIGDEGRTLLFVSHQNEALMGLCERGVCLEKGKIKYIGIMGECLEEYWASTINGACGDDLSIREDTICHGRIIFKSVTSEKTEGERCKIFTPLSDLVIKAKFTVNEYVRNVEIGLPLSHNRLGYFTEINSELKGNIIGDLAPGQYVVQCAVPRLPLNKGEYYYDIFCRSSKGVEFHLKKANSFSISDVMAGVGSRHQGTDRPLLLEHTFTVDKVGS